MRTAHRLHCGLAWVTLIGMCIAPTAALGADDPGNSIAPPDAALTVSDIELGPGGVLTGQLIDGDTRPLNAANVTVFAGGRTIAAATTDSNGAFAVAGLRSGFHQLAAGNAIQNYRFWAAGTAPPKAGKAVQLIDQSGLVRGQWGPPPRLNRFVRGAKVWATNPFVVGGVIAAAVAIPVALNNDDEGPSS